MKRLLLLPVLCLSILTSMAQEATVRLLVKPDATEVTFVYRLAQQGATAQIDLGGGETATLEQPYKPLSTHLQSLVTHSALLPSRQIS